MRDADREKDAVMVSGKWKSELNVSDVFSIVRRVFSISGSMLTSMRNNNEAAILRAPSRESTSETHWWLTMPARCVTAAASAAVVLFDDVWARRYLT